MSVNTHLEFLSFKRWLHRLDWIYTCQNATFLEITCRGSIFFYFVSLRWCFTPHAVNNFSHAGTLPGLNNWILNRWYLVSCIAQVLWWGSNQQPFDLTSSTLSPTRDLRTSSYMTTFNWHTGSITVTCVHQIWFICLYILSDRTKAAHYRAAGKSPFQWRFAGGPMTAQYCMQIDTISQSMAF